MKLITIPGLEGWAASARCAVMPTDHGLEVDQFVDQANARNPAVIPVQASPIIHRPREVDARHTDVRYGSWVGSVARRFGDATSYQSAAGKSDTGVVAGSQKAATPVSVVSPTQALCGTLNQALADELQYHGTKGYNISDIRTRLAQLHFGEIWHKFCDLHLGIGEVCVTLCIHYSGDNVLAVNFKPSEGKLLKAQQCSLTQFVFSADCQVIVATRPARQKPREVLLSLFDNEKVSLTGEALQHAAIFFIEKELMLGYQHVKHGWPAIPQNKFSQRWAETDFKVIWKKVKEKYPDLKSATAVFSINFGFGRHVYGAPAFKHPDSKLANTGGYVFARIVFSDEHVLMKKIWDVSKRQGHAAKLYGYSRGNPSLTVPEAVHERFRPVTPFVDMSQRDTASPTPAPVVAVVEPILEVEDIGTNLSFEVAQIRARSLIYATFMAAGGISKTKTGYPPLFGRQLDHILSTLRFDVLRKKLLKPQVFDDGFTATLYFKFRPDGTVIFNVYNGEFDLPNEANAAIVRIHFNKNGVYIHKIQDNDRAETYRQRLKRFLKANRHYQVTPHVID